MSRTKEELTEEMNRKKHEEEQAKHRMQRAQNRKDYFESTLRKQRTHRLITRGAALESIIPEAKEMGERAFYDAVETYFAIGNHRNEFCAEIARANATAEKTNRRITDRAKPKEKTEADPDVTNVSNSADTAGYNNTVSAQVSHEPSGSKTMSTSTDRKPGESGAIPESSVMAQKGGA